MIENIRRMEAEIDQKYQEMDYLRREEMDLVLEWVSDVVRIRAINRSKAEIEIYENNFLEFIKRSDERLEVINDSIKGLNKVRDQLNEFKRTYGIN